MARVLSASDDATFKLSAENLAKGLLVGFPTETVYGLGAHALDANAVLSIFAAKKRPLTDPVIVHISSLADALPLVTISHPSVQAIFFRLARRFWPGPLTVILPASNLIPNCVTANSGYVGVRCPNHPVALKLLASSKLPIAAPSANRFGHVSPTTAQHVMDDLSDVDSLIVIDGGRSTVGVESTVVKIEEQTVTEVGVKVHCRLTVLRRGAVSVTQLQESLSELKIEESDSSAPSRTVHCVVTALTPHYSSDAASANVAPGMLLKHYAPDLPTFLVAPPVTASATQLVLANNAKSDAQLNLATSVVIDFGGSLAALQSTVLAYRDLSSEGSFEKAAFGLFDSLRWSENVAGAKSVILCDVLSPHIRVPAASLSEAVYDRLYRAASGNFAQVN
eukprot:c10324_g1_i2.p1 GENE.c10324_g1_i2~~c10324_g1_i2.p1  ORF type:complete len:449 (+),score=73.00 c10324_g1_i2:171-1349(+)